MEKLGKHKHLPLRKRFDPSYWENFNASNLSDQNPSTGVTPDQDPTTWETSDQNPTIGETSDVTSDQSPKIGQTSKKETTYDFVFVMKPVRVLKTAFEALSDTTLNPKEMAVIQVGPGGCEITSATSRVLGYLSLKTTGLEGFQCNNPSKKKFSLRGIPRLFRSAERYKIDSVSVFSVQGSNQLSFQWGTNASDFGLGFPFRIELKDAKPAAGLFPKCVSYGFEAILQSFLFRKMSRNLRRHAKPRPETVKVTLRPGTISINTGIKVVTAPIKCQGQEHDCQHRISTEWKCWESFVSASFIADKASVYLLFMRR